MPACMSRRVRYRNGLRRNSPGLGPNLRSLVKRKPDSSKSIGGSHPSGWVITLPSVGVHIKATRTAFVQRVFSPDQFFPGVSEPGDDRCSRSSDLRHHVRSSSRPIGWKQLTWTPSVTHRPCSLGNDTHVMNQYSTIEAAHRQIQQTKHICPCSVSEITTFLLEARPSLTFTAKETLNYSNRRIRHAGRLRFRFGCCENQHHDIQVVCCNRSLLLQCTVLRETLMLRIFRSPRWR